MTSNAPAAIFAASLFASQPPDSEIDRAAEALRSAEDYRAAAKLALDDFDAAHNFTAHWSDETMALRKPLWNIYVRSHSPIPGLVNALLAAYNAAGGR